MTIAETSYWQLACLSVSTDITGACYQCYLVSLSIGPKLFELVNVEQICFLHLILIKFEMYGVLGFWGDRKSVV